MGSSALAHCHVRRLLSNRQTWSIATALLCRTYQSVSSGSVHISTSDKEKLRERRKALIFANEKRRIDRLAREDFTEGLHDILKNRQMLGLIDRGDRYVSVRELVRDSILFLLQNSNKCFILVELPTFSNVIFLIPPNDGERRWKE
jgi:hypothetical protein